MDPYIKNFQIETIKTETVANCDEGNQVLKVNNNFSNFKLLHNNIRSINKNFDEFKTYIQQFDFDFECLVLTETWEIPDPELYQINGYNLIYNNGNYNQNDGTVIYVKSDIEFCFDIITLGDNKLIEVKASFQDKKIIILCFYRPPSSCPHEFNKNLKTYLDNHKNNAAYYFFVGDLNIDILKNLDYANDYLNVLHEYGYISAINNFTRCTNTTKSCIDHIFLKTNLNLEYILPLIIQTTLTDHYIIAVQVILTSNNDINSNNNNHLKVIKQTDFKKLEYCLNQVNWDDVYRAEDTESATTTFLEIIKNNVDICTKNIKIKRNKMKRKSWITNGIINSINTRDRMFQRLLKDPNNKQLAEDYKNYRNFTTKLIKKTKVNYYKNKINENKNNSKNLWETVKDICKQSRQQNKIDYIKNNNGDKIQDPKLIANVFNCNYIGTGKKLASNIKKSSTYKVTKKTLINSIFLKPTNRNEVHTTISLLKNNKSAGIDGLKAEVLKHISHIICEPLAYIINKCMEKGYFPSAFKTSIVIPIFKTGDRMEASNYRPISLITNFAKVFEKIIKVRLNDFLKKFKILSEMQYGFREGKSTQDAILALTSKVYTALDESIPSLAVFIDLAKAFDTVSHAILVETLEQIGIRNCALDLFTSYISDRYQCVKIKNTLSDLEKIEYGVPQGTVLGPILFIIYLNGLFSTQSSGTIITYADDTAIYYSADSWPNLKSMVERDMGNIKDWFDHNLLTINFSKTFYVPFCSNKLNIPDFGPLRLGDIYIEPTKEIKYLGVKIDSHLKWDAHINYVVRKIRTVLYKFKKLGEVLETKELKVLYYSLVESHLIYGILAWGSAAKTHLKNLEIIQKKILKIIFKKEQTYPSDALFEESGVLDVRQLFYFHCNVKQHNDQNYLTKFEHMYSTRQRGHTYKVPFIKKTIGQKSYTYLGPKLYNSLNIEIRNITSIHQFKIKLRNHIKCILRKDIHVLITN